MKILMTGSNGLVGSALVNHFQDHHEIVRLVRSRPLDKETEVYWDPSEGEIEDRRLNGVDVVIHLAGEPIVGRWSSKKKERIKQSRVEGTEQLARTMAAQESVPDLFVSASAIGYYGDRGDEVLTETSEPGDMFLSGVCEEWERATEPASDAGMRVAHTRFGIILSTKGGALSKMLLPFYFCLGGRIGDGEQWMSWIALDDVVRMIDHIIEHEELEGPINGVSPNPVRNKHFTNALGDVIGRPTPFPMPAFAARLVFGEMADELLLVSARVKPDRLRESDFLFNYAQIRDALLHCTQKET